MEPRKAWRWRALVVSRIGRRLTLVSAAYWACNRLRPCPVGVLNGRFVLSESLTGYDPTRSKLLNGPYCA
jgi:hypothetical protein